MLMPSSADTATPRSASALHSSDRRRALAAGYEMHLPKPFEPKELVAALVGLARMGVTA